ncbi:hypothetical protein QBC43DRAFT_349542 [Cladorrhinum sp. PSN259]|nr:hypothetical protein QBC43DRAFT_349542 [Cladorrhinum sp. PSN259]
MSFKSLPDYGINDPPELSAPKDSSKQESVGSKPPTEPQSTSDNAEPEQPIDIITTLGVYPEAKDQVEEHLIKLGKQVEAEEPDCLQWEVFYLNSTGELVLIERFKNLAAAEYHWQMQYNQNVLRYLTDQGWLSGLPDMKRLKSRGGFAFRSRLTNLN